MNNFHMHFNFHDRIKRVYVCLVYMSHKRKSIRVNQFMCTEYVYTCLIARKKILEQNTFRYLKMSHIFLEKKV